MIRRFSEEGRAPFLDAVRGKPYFGDVLPVHLAVFGTDNALVRFYLAQPAAAVQLRGQSAILCGSYDAEETGAFLRMQGITRVTASGGAPAGFGAGETLYTMALRHAVSRQPAPALPGLALDTAPPPGEVTDFLMRNEVEPCAWDNFYSELCTKLSRGAALVWAVRQNGGIVSTAGAYALTPSSAYLAAIETREELRGRGLGSWLTAALAARLTEGGRRAALSCREERLSFYERIGFFVENTVSRYFPIHTESGESG